MNFPLVWIAHQRFYSYVAYRFIIIVIVMGLVDYHVINTTELAYYEVGQANVSELELNKYKITLIFVYLNLLLYKWILSNNVLWQVCHWLQ